MKNEEKLIENQYESANNQKALDINIRNITETLRELTRSLQELKMEMKEIIDPNPIWDTGYRLKESAPSGEVSSSEEIS